jgi:Ca2+-binding EF-hand superfamily protein
VVGLSVISKNVSFKETVELAFKTIDRNHDGKIDIAEFQGMVKSLFNNLEEEQIQNLFKRIDKDGDNVISKGNVVSVPFFTEIYV